MCKQPLDNKPTVSIISAQTVDVKNCGVVDLSYVHWDGTKFEWESKFLKHWWLIL